MQIDLTSWKMKDMVKWTDFLKGADYAGITAMVVPVVKAWEKGEVTQEALMDLSPKEWKTLITEVSTEVGKSFQD